MPTNNLKSSDPEVDKIIASELARMRRGVELIPSENVVSPAVLEALGSVMTNKYSEGYPKKRYYGGNQHIDEVELLAIDRAKKLFGAEHVNVQPYSGSPANMAALFAMAEPGDTVMGLDLGAGGHLTHGSPVNFSGKLFKIVPYNVNQKTQLLDMDEIKAMAKKHKPKVIISGLTAYPRTLDFKAFQKIADEVGAYHMSDIAHIAGLCATGVHESPVPVADVVTTTTHKTLRGPRGGMILSKENDRLRPDDKKNLAQKIDFEVFPGIQGGPHDHATAAKAVAFGEALLPAYKTYCQQVVKNAKRLADELKNNDLSLVTNGTDNHLLLIDLTKVNNGDLTGKGKEVQDALEAAEITVNRNTIPYEPSSPFKPSGVRLGTPAVTTRGMAEDDMSVIAEAIAMVVKDHKNETIINSAKKLILELTKKYPLYPEL
ncbi:serine hydroxymethyltransferase [bacterium]|nr:serine hydroxymethyltransferase [bacterium]|tara:strand:+ start:717 stop:2009 length:1293 start_codon:yes stop_codon:yes gene_type:complete